MFDRLLFWLREKARLLFGENTTVSASVSYSMENAIILWAQMYDTGGPWCHGGKNALHSLKLAQSVASELARLTTLEMECLVSAHPGGIRLCAGRHPVPALPRCTGLHPDRCCAG